MRKIELSAGFVFWLGAFLLLFGFIAFNAVTAADLPGSSFALAPVSKVELIPNEKLTLTYAPEKLDSKATEKTFSDISGLIDIKKTALIGDAEFKISICRDVSQLKALCSEYAKDKFTCLKTRDAFVLTEICEETAPGKGITMKSGEKIRIEPTRMIYESTPKYPNGYFLVWEDLFVGGERIEGATWWAGIAMTLRDWIAPTGDSNRNTDYYKVYQTFKPAFTGTVCVVSYIEASTGANPGPTNMNITLKNSSGVVAVTNSSLVFAQDGSARNASFTTCPTLIYGADYILDFVAPSSNPGVLGLKASAADGRSDACLGRDTENTCVWGDSTSANIQLWGFDADTTPPAIDACYPANGSSVSTGTTQFRINATDETGLAALNHTDTFTGATAYNFTPGNGSAWYVDVDFNTSGNFYWWAWANDTSGNAATTGNCSLTVVVPGTTTTVAPAGNVTVINATISIPGFGWAILFFIILVSFVVLGGISRG